MNDTDLVLALTPRGRWTHVYDKTAERTLCGISKQRKSLTYIPDVSVYTPGCLICQKRVIQ